MMTVHEVSQLTKVSVRTLQYYDRIGLLKPAARTESGYRLYDEASLERLQLILLYRVLEFPLRDIAAILDAPDYDRNRALGQQIELLTLKIEHLRNLIDLARGIRVFGVRNLSFEPFDTKQLDDYIARARTGWDNTPEYEEYERRTWNRTEAEQNEIAARMMDIFADFGTIKDQSPDSPEAQALVQNLRDFITENFYHCSNTVLLSLGRMYSGGGEYTATIDNAGGPGTAAFATAAIEVYCENHT